MIFLGGGASKIGGPSVMPQKQNEHQPNVFFFQSEICLFSKGFSGDVIFSSKKTSHISAKTPTAASDQNR